MLPVALIFPFLWGRAETRLSAALLSAVYFLAASRGLPQGAAAYFGSGLTPAVLLWLLASAGFVAVHTVLWGRTARWRPVRYLAVALLTAVPPFGITGWAHPVTAAGVLFPGWGWWGVGAMAAGLLGLVSPRWPAAAVAIIGAWLWSALSWTEPTVAKGWRGVHLQMGAALGREVNLPAQRDMIATVISEADDGASIVVLPESALGFWTPTVERVWLAGLGSRPLTVIAGASVVDDAGYDNVLIRIEHRRAEVIYRQRMPVPGAMWQPWRSLLGYDGGARARLLGNAGSLAGGAAIAPIICYEQLLVWPILQSMWTEPEVIVVVGNGWWASATSIVAIQRASAVAWARLFGLPLILAFNS